MTELVLESQVQIDETGDIETAGGGRVMFTPPVSESYWLYRVQLSDSGQAIIGFPKFGTIGVGFAIENDWNTNLPYTSGASQIFAHIEHNKSDTAISDADCLTAIQMVIAAATAVKAAS